MHIRVCVCVCVCVAVLHTGGAGVLNEDGGMGGAAGGGGGAGGASEIYQHICTILMYMYVYIGVGGRLVYSGVGIICTHATHTHTALIVFRCAF